MLLRRKGNKRTGFKETKDDDLFHIYFFADRASQESKKPRVGSIGKKCHR